MSPVGRVPVLVDDGFAVWDTLAIAEYVAEKFPDKHLWPKDAKARARARSVCAEMHSGFSALRSHCPMNIEASLPQAGALVWRDQPAVRKDVQRIVSMWTELLEEHKGPMLFGEFSIADAYFAPVCMRPEKLRAAGPGGASAAYIRRAVSTLPGRARPGSTTRCAGARLRRLRGRALPQQRRSGAANVARRPKLAAMQTYHGRRRGARRAAGPARSTIATGSWSAPRPRDDRRRATCRWAATSRCSFIRRRARSTRWRAPSARPRRGYHGFAFHAEPDVTLEQDLARRDLTINAMAQDEDGRLIDPVRRPARPKARVLRHVTPGLSRGPGAHPARGALRGALRRLHASRPRPWR